jgi:hypothetical protein
MIGLRVRTKPTAPSSTPSRPIAAGHHPGMLGEPRRETPDGTTRGEAAAGAAAGVTGTEGRSATVAGRAAASAARTSSRGASGVRAVTGTECASGATVS